MSESQMDTTPPPSCWTERYETLVKNHDKIDNLIQEAEKFADNEKDEAVKLYIKALTLIDKVLAEPLVCPENPDLSWEKAGVMVQKLKKSKKDVMSRVADLQTSGRKRRATEESQESQAAPPSYEEAMGLPSPTAASPTAASASGAEASAAGTSGATSPKSPKTLEKKPVIIHVPRTYRELAEALQQLEVRQLDDGSEGLFPQDMTNVEMVEQEAEILFSHDNVQLYFIKPNGEVTCSTEPLPMQIVRLSGKLDGNTPPAYLQVGHWVYPLVPGLSPCFHANYHAFILPDVHSLVEGAAVGIMLPEDADGDALQCLESLLNGYLLDAPLADTRAVHSRRRRADVEPRTLMTSVVRGAQYIRDNLIRGAERAGSALNNTTPYVISKLEKEKPKEIDPSVSQGLKIAKDVSGKAVTVSSFVAGKLSSGTMALGRFLAPHVQKQGTRLLSNYMDEREAQSRVNSMLQFTAGAVEALGTVYSGLEEASKILSKSIANNTVIVVKHKYGNQAGEVVHNSFDTIGNVMTVTHTVNKLTPKGVVKITAKEAGKAIVHDQQKQLRDEASGSQNTTQQAQIDRLKEAKAKSLANEVD